MLSSGSPYFFGLEIRGPPHLPTGSHSETKTWCLCNVGLAEQGQKSAFGRAQGAEHSCLGLGGHEIPQLHPFRSFTSLAVNTWLRLTSLTAKDVFGPESMTKSHAPYVLLWFMEVGDMHTL